MQFRNCPFQISLQSILVKVLITPNILFIYAAYPEYHLLQIWLHTRGN